MDTRSKIVDAGECCSLGRTALVTGYFDPLLAWHSQEFERLRNGVAGLIAIVLPLDHELLPQPSRAALVAALRMVDYVLIAKHEDLDGLFALLQPAEIVRLEAGDLRRRGQLMETIRCRQTC